MQSYEYEYQGMGFGRGHQQQQQCYSPSSSPLPSSYSGSYNPKPKPCQPTGPAQTGCQLDPTAGLFNPSPAAFPPGTDPKIVDCFTRIDRDGDGFIDDRELQSVLSSSSGYNFSLRAVHLLMYQFTHSNKRQITPKEFVPLLNCLQSWRAIFQRFDRDRSGTIDSMELGQAFASLGFKVSPQIVNLLLSKFSKSGGRCSLTYDGFIECCLIVKGLTETFRAKEDVYGRATFAYEEFLLSVLPFIIA